MGWDWAQGKFQMGSTVRLALPLYPSLGTGRLACKEFVTCQVA